MPSISIRNFGLKALSIFIAALLWLVVAGDSVVERVLRVPVELQNLPSELEIVSNPPDMVEVRLRGSSGTLSRMASGDVATVIDLRAARPGRRLFHLTPGQVKAPYGLETVQVSPATLALEFETSGVRVVRVSPTVDGRPAAGFELAGVRSEPETVEVAGPASALKQLREAITEPISVADRRETVQEVVTVGVIDPSVRVRSPQTVTVTVTIAPVKP
ncbi:MAG: YbbR-like domain-containing protein [Acidobacteria bacterium]|nr:YbbR-like domain-containing protein [Acidobacteriota bacterium]